MGHIPSKLPSGLDAIDLLVVVGFACVVIGIAWRYDYALALIVFGVGLLFIGALAAWRRA